MPDSNHDVAWSVADRPISGLGTDGKRNIEIKREAVPLVFVPGIMGSNLRRSLRNADTNQKDMIWPVSDNTEMWKMYSGTSPEDRKLLLVGPRGFTSGYLEVADTDPPGDGFAGIRSTYHPFLHALRDHPWEELGKVFEFPVYAVGYDWTDSSQVAGEMLKARISKIIEECKGITGACEKAILITHSMGGIVARSAMILSVAKDLVLGVIHGVQPVTGSPAAYWRMKGGFEGSWWGGHWLFAVNRVLGPSGPHVTAVLANIPGGLQLLPNKQYRPVDWLRITGMTPMPKSDPYKEIYKVKAVVQPQSDAEPSNNAYWGLVDPELLNFGASSEPRPAKVDPNNRNAMANARAAFDPWRQYLANLDVAEKFHDTLGLQAHDDTYWFNGVGHATAVSVEMHTEWRMVRWDPYRVPGFRGWFVDAEGYDRQAVLQLPNDLRGDATVPRSSARALKENKSPPGCRQFTMEHEPAYGNEHGPDENALRYTVAAITALAKKRLKDLGKIK
jgi:hypothetical protein